VEKVKVKEQGQFTAQIAIEMPFDIKTLSSPTHKLRMKVSGFVLFLSTQLRTHQI
jgi:hypothetical protein